MRPVTGLWSGLKSVVTGGGWEEAPKWLLTAFAVATGALATVGVTNSSFQRALTNESELFLVAVASLLAAIVLGVLGVAASGKGTKGALSLTGLIAFYLGGFVLLLAVSKSEYIRERPTITVLTRNDTVTGGLFLDVSVTANRLRAKDHVLISVWGWPLSAKPDSTWVRLYDVRTGPDREGKLSNEFAVAIPRGEYEAVNVGVVRVEGDQTTRNRVDCDESSTTLISCSTILLSPPATLPSVDVDVSGTGADRLMKVTFSQGDLRASDVLVADVLEISGGRINSSWASPSGSGLASGTLDVPLGTKVSPICVRVWVQSAGASPSPAPTSCAKPTNSAFAEVVDFSRLATPSP